MTRPARSLQSARTRAAIAGEKVRAREFIALCAENDLPAPEPQYPAVAGRKFRWDFAWNFTWDRGGSIRVLLEVQGGIWNGKHGRGSGVIKDMAKANAAALAGYRVLYVQPKDLCTSATIEMVRTAFEWHPFWGPVRR